VELITKNEEKFHLVENRLYTREGGNAHARDLTLYHEDFVNFPTRQSYLFWSKYVNFSDPESCGGNDAVKHLRNSRNNQQKGFTEIPTQFPFF
jgi:hypothetical protein